MVASLNKRQARQDEVQEISWSTNGLCVMQNQQVIDKMEADESKASSGVTDKSETKDDLEETEHFLRGYKTVEEYTQAGYKILMEGVRCSNNLPNGKNRDFYTSFPSFKGIMDNEGEKVLLLMSRILQYQGIRGSIGRRDLEEKFNLVVEANDTVLQRVGYNLDELSGIHKNSEPLQLVEAATPTISGSWNKNHLLSTANKNIPPASLLISGTIPKSSTTAASPKPVRLLAARNIQRPQLKFKDKVDNSCNPFEPRIKDKPNSLKPLAIVQELSETGDECYSHPYEFELEHFKVPTTQLKSVKPRMYKSLSETPLIIIEHADQLPGLLQDLSKYSEIAVDLEHHSYRTFQGFTCLMQISTQDTDYIIDTLELRDKLHCLNEVFTKPTVIKVFHGAFHDIEWLQRDLSLYVVNMFDTHQAAKALNFAHFSLAFLLKHYCNVIADKHFQLADWRIRPLPEELLMYARQDTHYLLYIYHKMRNALLKAANGESNILASVIQNSTELCKRRYEKPILKDDSHMRLYRRQNKMFNNRQLYALKELYQWRDKFARLEDESTGYVLPNHMLMQIAEALPREMQGILACCNPIPPMVRRNLLTLHQIVLKAREEPLVKPIFAEEIRAWTVGKQIDLENALHCPHDLTHNEDFRDDLPTLLGKSLRFNKKGEKSMKKEPNISLFGDTVQFYSEEGNNWSDSTVIEERLRRVTFFPPYGRYKQERQSVKKQQRENNEEAPENANTSVQEQGSGILESTQKEIESNHNQVNALEADIENDPHVQGIKQHFMEVTAKLQSKEANNEIQEHLQPSKQTSIESSLTEEEPLRNQESRACPKKRKRNKRRMKTQHVKKLRGREQEEALHPPKAEFEKFDYRKVDFNNFKGGSKVSQNSNDQLQHKFKSKGKKTRGKKNKNKSVTFKKD